jgi:dTMP kinase
MFASRAQHVKELIDPCLRSGKWCVCDRFTDASYAYQGGGRGLSQKHIKALETMVHLDLQPNLTLLLDIKPTVGFKRIAKRQHQDRIEQEKHAFFSRVRAAYLHRAKSNPERFVIINANQVLSKVKNDVKIALESFIRGYIND